MDTEYCAIAIHSTYAWTTRDYQERPEKLSNVGIKAEVVLTLYEPVVWGGEPPVAITLSHASSLISASDVR